MVRRNACEANMETRRRIAAGLLTRYTAFIANIEAMVVRAMPPCGFRTLQDNRVPGVLLYHVASLIYCHIFFQNRIVSKEVQSVPREEPARAVESER
jgi:hypothetical protein